MKLKLKTPIEVDGNIYEDVTISLSLSTNTQDVEQYMFACNLVPYRIDEEGVIHKLEDVSLPMSVINVLDSQYTELGTEILTAFQNHLNKM